MKSEGSAGRGVVGRSVAAVLQVFGRTKRARVFLLLMAAVFALQYATSDMAVQKMPLSKPPPLLGQGLRTPHFCMPVLRKVFPTDTSAAPYVMHAGDKSGAREGVPVFDMKADENLMVKVGNFDCFPQREGNKEMPLMLFASIPADKVYNPSVNGRFVDEALPEVDFTKLLRIECTGDAIVTTPVGVPLMQHSMGSLNQCRGQYQSEADAKIRALQKQATARFMRYETINIVCQCVLCVMLLCFYGLEWKRLDGMLSETMKVLETRLVLTKKKEYASVLLLWKMIVTGVLLWRLSFFLFALNGSSSTFANCRLADAFANVEVTTLHFPCRSLNPLMSSILWGIVYAVFIYTFDSAVMNATQNTLSCAQVLAHVPCMPMAGKYERSGWCRLLCSSCSGECRSKALLFAQKGGESAHAELHPASSFFKLEKLGKSKILEVQQDALPIGLT